MNENINKKLEYLEFLNRENNFSHHKYDEEMLQYEYIKNGDLRAVDESKKMIRSENSGHLSDEPLKNLLYLCICSVTLVTRFAIEGGMEHEKAYNASDLYIQKFDKAKSLDELYNIHTEMISYFVKSVYAEKNKNVYSKQVIQCIDYIHHHLHEEISCVKLADMVNLNQSYLSVLFKRETGVSITEYVILKRMEAAENMLKYSEYSLTDISDFLHFSSYSHFARTFRKYYKTSPKEYRKNNFRHTGWKSEN
ncbi:MAG: AraC family transcriptional regulator [Ruminococcus flavefaciens]|nr:AraC family transcriptional regulator [Ruminococcus flavefaciens]